MTTPNPQSPLDAPGARAIIEELATDGHNLAEIVRELARYGINSSSRSVGRALRRFGIDQTGAGPQGPATTVRGDQADVRSGAVRAAELAEPHELLRERGLDPEEWEITSVTVNEWDSPSGPMKQLKLSARRRKPVEFVIPANEPSYKRPSFETWRSASDPVLCVLVGDQQAPYHDEKLHDLFIQWLHRNRPAQGILVGDTLDFPDISRHRDNPEWHVSAQECIDSAFSLLMDYVRASEATEWRKLMGNHDERLRTELLNRAERLYGIRPAGETEHALSLKRLLHLDALGIDLVEPDGNYTHAQARLSANAAVRHGWLVGKDSGQAALKSVDALGHTIVIGHTHKQSIVGRTVYDIDGHGSTLWGVETGCMCKSEGGLGYTVAPDWQQGFAVATLWPDDTVHIDLAKYNNGVLTWRDQRYE